MNNLFETQKEVYESTIEVLKTQIQELRAETSRLLDIIEKRLQ